MDLNDSIQTISRMGDAKVMLTAEQTDAKCLMVSVPSESRVIDGSAFVEAWERTQPAPSRRRGYFTAGSLESLIYWADKNIDGAIGVKPLPADLETPEDDSVPPAGTERINSLTFFATGLETVGTRWAAPDLSLKVIGNYSSKDQAAWHDFGGAFKFPVSTDWTRWANGNNKWMDQKAFSAFIDDVAGELAAPIQDEVPEIAQRWLAATESKAATPIEMLRLSRGLRLTIKKKIQDARNAQTGEGGIEIMSEHSNESGERLSIPSLFFISVSIFIDSDPTIIPVRLRYDAEDGVKWQYELLRPDLFVRDTFIASLQAVAQRGHQVIMGTPDMPVMPRVAENK